MAVVLACGLLLAAAGAAAGAWRSQGSTATAVVLVAPLEGNPFSPEGQGEELVNLESEAQLVRSADVGLLVQRTLGEDVSVDDLLAGLDVEVPVNTQILEIEYDAGRADVATERAQAFADAYLGYRAARADGLKQQRSRAVRTQIDEESRRLNELVAQARDAQGADEQALLAGRVDAASAQVTELRGQLAELSVGSTDPGQVVTPASAAGGGSSLPLLGAIAGGLLGLVGGAGLVLARGWLAGGLRRPEEVTGLGLPVAARVPGGDLRPAAGAAGRGEWDTDPESVRLLRAAVLARLSPGAQGATVLVSRLVDVDEETPSGLARALAAAAARSAVPTVLVEVGTGPANGPTTGSTTGPGLAEVLRGRTELDRALVAEDEHLEVLRVGDGAGSLDDLVVAPGMRRVLRQCATRAELVLVAAPALDAPSGRGLVEMVDGLLVEVRPSDTPEQVDAAVRLADSTSLAWTRAAWVDPADGPAAPTPGDQAPAKQAPAQKTPAKQAPAKQAPAKQAPAKKTPAKKTPGSGQGTSAPSRGTGPGRS